MPLKFTANLSFLFNEYENYLDRFLAAANSGFQAVECGTEIYKFSIKDLVDAKESAKQITIVQLVEYKGGLAGLAAVPGQEEKFRNNVEKTIKYAVALECPRVHVLAGIFPDSENFKMKSSDWEETYVNNLTYAAERLEKAGIVLLIEPISTIPNYFLTDTNRAVEIIEKVPSKNIKLQLDLFHAQMTHGNLINTLKKYLSFIDHIQVSQSPDRGEPDAHGEINYAYIFKFLDQSQYKGWIGCEYKPRGNTEEGLVWMKNI